MAFLMKCLARKQALPSVQGSFLAFLVANQTRINDREFIVGGGTQPNTEPSRGEGLDGSATAEERDNYHRDAYENTRNHASGPPARCPTTPASEPRRVPACPGPRAAPPYR